MDKLDYDICASEPIHIPGLIQPFGYAISYEKESFIISGVSENIPKAKKFLGKEIRDYLPDSIIDELKSLSLDESINSRVFYGIKEKFFNNEKIDMIYSNCKGEGLLEFVEYSNASKLITNEVFDKSISNILSTSTLEDVYKKGIQEIQDLTGYDRVMLYKFDEDFNGQVLAEIKNQNIKNSYLGINFPASDIPPQARELYRKQLARIIQDVNYTPKNFIRKGKLGALDLTYSTLRSISPIHIEYLKNMKVGATLTLSIVIEGRLWGLIACHNSSKHQISLKQFELCKNITRLISCAIKNKEEDILKQRKMFFVTTLDNGVNEIRRKAPQNILDGIIEHKFLFQSLFECDGFWIMDEDSYLNGKNKKNIRKLVQIAIENFKDDYFICDSLLNIESSLDKNFIRKYAGALVVRTVFKDKTFYWIWYKKEFSKSLLWGGDPYDKMDIDQSGKISPRKSFKTFKQIVKYHSTSWDKEYEEFILSFKKTMNNLLIWHDKLLQNKEHESLIQRMEDEKEEHLSQLLEALVEMIEHRDAYTAGHTKRVATYCLNIAQELKMGKNDIDTLYEAAMLHDIGKIVVPDSILLKPGRLDNQEFKLIQNHLDAGYKILKNIKFYVTHANIIKDHHEKYDGSGYPNGLKKDEISLSAHILIVADAIDAMTSKRIYQARKSFDEAIDEIERYSGIWYHPKVVEAVKKVFKGWSVKDIFSQIPVTSIEEARFSYYFKDQLTGAYNEEYLKMILNGYIPTKNVCCALSVQIHGMTKFNEKFGWHAGNNVISHIYESIHSIDESFDVFRVTGDDFIVILDQCTQDIVSRYDSLKLLGFKEIEVEINKIDIVDLNQIVDPSFIR